MEAARCNDRTNTAPPKLLHGILVCPRCGNDALEAVSDGDDTNFLCPACWSCWHWNQGYMIAVPALTCPGCPHKAECLRRRGHD
jgi:uncharacterized protein YbaR (Trm112 family)